MQLTIETMLQAAANPITHKRHIPYQMLIVGMPKSMACTSPCLLLSAAVVSTLRLTRTFNPLLRASCAVTFMTWSWPAIASCTWAHDPRTDRAQNFCKHIACVRQHEHAEVEWVLERLTEKFYPNLTSKACWLSLWASKESERHPSQMPRLLLERGIRGSFGGSFEYIICQNTCTQKSILTQQFLVSVFFHWAPFI